MYKITVLQFCKAKQTRSPTLSFLDVDLWHSSGFKESKYIYFLLCIHFPEEPFFCFVLFPQPYDELQYSYGKTFFHLLST